MKILKFFEDPGHGWAAVSRIELRQLGLLDKISHYSYQGKGLVYLEEDCDLSLYLRKLESLDTEFEIVRHHCTDNDSFIRSLQCFQQ